MRRRKFEPDELVDAVAFGETIDRFRAVLDPTPHEIAGHAEIQRSVFAAGEHVNVIGHHDDRGYGLRLALASAKADGSHAPE